MRRYRSGGFLLRYLKGRLYLDESGQEIVEVGWVDVADRDDAQVGCGGGAEGGGCCDGGCSDGCGFGLGNLHPFGDPRAEPAEGLGTLLQGAKMPAEAKAVLVQKCADCHSNETRWPVYARLAPGSWLMELDIVRAREKMDLSRWEQIPADQQEVLMAKIVEEARSGDMPPLQYRLLHWDAKLSKGDVLALSMLGKSPGGSEAALGGEGDAVRGKAVFEKRCIGLPCAGGRS